MDGPACIVILKPATPGAQNMASVSMELVYANKDGMGGKITSKINIFVIINLGNAVNIIFAFATQALFTGGVFE